MHAVAAKPLPAASGDPDDGPGDAVNAGSGVAVFVPGGAVDAGSGVAVFVPSDPVNVGEGVSGASEKAIRICNS